MRMFRLYGEGTRHLTRGVAAARRLSRRLSDDDIAGYRVEKVLIYEEARAQGLSPQASAKVADEPLSNLYRWRYRYHRGGERALEDKSRRPHNPRAPTAITRELIAWVIAKRKKHPWGKRPLAERWRRRCEAAGAPEKIVSVSTIGRVISAQLRKGDGSMVSARPQPSWQAAAARGERPHAKRRRQRVAATRYGEQVQIDHMKVYVGGGRYIPLFTARDVATRFGWAMPMLRATADYAGQFLRHVIATAAAPIRSIQTDGGGEFKGAFEAACQDAGIELFIIPPRSPKFNAEGENYNGIIRREVIDFVACPRWTYETIGEEVALWLPAYNGERPNMALWYYEGGVLRYQTPAERRDLLMSGGSVSAEGRIILPPGADAGN